MVVRPFSGDHYGKVSPFNLPILILGESSYNSEHPPCRRGELLAQDWNERIIDCVRRSAASGKPEKDNTITRAAGVFYGQWRSWGQRWDFWQSSAFANFVQVDMGCHGQRPSDSEWEGGKGPFQEYLNKLKPGFVLALGAALWEHLPTPRSKGRSS